MEEKDTLFSKIDNFFYHYKLHMFLGTVGLIIIIWMAYSIIGNMIEEKRIENQPTSLNVLMFGDYKIGNQYPLLEENLKAAFPEWEPVRINIEYVPTDSESFEDIAAMQRSVAILYSENPDIYVFDQNEYDKFLEAGTYERLDDYFPDQAEAIWVQKENDTEEHVYGIDITDSKLFANLEINSIEKIAVINDQSERIETAIEFLQRALEE